MEEVRERVPRHNGGEGERTEWSQVRVAYGYIVRTKIDS